MPSKSGQPRVWLDVLPPELRTGIATHVCNGKQSEHALNLAETSPNQCAAVLSALDDVVSFENNHNASRWTKLFKSSVRQVTFDKYAIFPRPAEHNPLSLLSAPTLHRAEIPSSEPYLKAIANSPSLRLLRIFVQSNMDIKLLFATLQTLNLTELQLWCCERRSYQCAIRKMISYDPTAISLASSVGDLKALRVRCFHRDPIWKIIFAMPTLRQVIVECRVPEACMHRLREMQSVHIISVPGAVHLATGLGQVASVLVTSEKVADTDLDNVSKKCPRLNVLEISVSEGVEHTLYWAAQRMLKLRVLKLRWAEPDVWWPRSHGWNVAKFSEVTEGMILRAIRFLPDLTDLELLCARLSMKELGGILTLIGKKMKHFGTSIADQDEPPFERMELLLNVFVAHNTELRSLNFDVLRTQEMTMLGMMQNADPVVRLRQRNSLSSALRRLSRAVPRLDLDELENCTMWYFLH
eukprot:GFKZ01014068.1.p1 GENE.GFKZ01014068.1~~GFKZ01014068.1.p1  ORF type:complete len:467 (-),score=56.84 GFKZ01014068.1:624-2024(-)